MFRKKARRRLYLRITMLSIIFVLLAWASFLFMQNYNSVSLSQKMMNAIINNKTELAMKYARQLGLIEEDLEKTRDFVSDLETENRQLKEKLALLSQLQNLEAEIDSLRQQNEALTGSSEPSQQTASLGVEPTGRKPWVFETIEQGRAMLKDLRCSFRKVKARMGEIKAQEVAKKRQAQAEIDRVRSMVGNNGYVVRDGNPMPMTMPEVTDQASGIQVNVNFVK